MTISKGKPFSTAREDGKFGILNIVVEKNNDNDENTLILGTFIGNNKNHKILDQFKIIK